MEDWIMQIRRFSNSAVARLTVTASALLSLGAMTLLVGGCQGGRTDQFSNAPSGGSGEGAGSRTGAVYVLTNAANNGVAVFNRAADGTLTAAGTVPTGGRGAGVLLDSQGALVLSEDSRRLFAVNAGSDNVSVFDVQDSGGLRLTGTFPSGGDRPVSLTTRGGLLYVLNGGSAGNIAWLHRRRRRRFDAAGELDPAAEHRSDRALPTSGRHGRVQRRRAGTGPVQPDGRVLVVTERMTNRINTYTIGSNGAASAPRTQATPGETPFGFDFGQNGHLVVSEAFMDRPGEGAASSFRVTDDGSLSVATATIRSAQTAACWAAVPDNGRFAYVSNPIAGTITGYAISGANGTLSLLDPSGSAVATGGDPRDMAFQPRPAFPVRAEQPHGRGSGQRLPG
jgi:6-phosphogluconolactonase (cycloisomerase 2 family)